MSRSMFGSISRLGPGRYRIRWSEKGERRSQVVHGTRDDAEVELARKRVAEADAATTWSQFWAAVVEPQIQGLALKTREEYRRLWRVELAPRIGAEPVRLMDWTRANEVLGEISSPSVQRHAGALLRKMCNMAVRDRSRLLERNPVDRSINYAPNPRPRKVMVESYNVVQYLEAFGRSGFGPVLTAMLGAGLRVEEACALLWEDVEAVEVKGRTYAALEVSKALITAPGGMRLKDTKNNPSARIAVCGDPFASRLLGWGEGKTGPLAPSGRRWRDARPESHYSSPSTISHSWRARCLEEGLPYVRPKDLRSSYATMMGEAMAPDSVVSGNMGHTDGTTKGRNYQAVPVAAKCAAAQMLADYLAGF